MGKKTAGEHGVSPRAVNTTANFLLRLLIPSVWLDGFQGFSTCLNEEYPGTEVLVVSKMVWSVDFPWPLFHLLHP